MPARFIPGAVFLAGLFAIAGLSAWLAQGAQNPSGGSRPGHGRQAGRRCKQVLTVTLIMDRTGAPTPSVPRTSPAADGCGVSKAADDVAVEYPRGRIVKDS